MADEQGAPGGGGPRSIDGLDVNEVEDGLVIYDGDRDRVHYLNPTAGVVFALCDGTHAEASLGPLVRDAYDAAEPSDEDVAECLAKLRTEGLVV